MRIPVKTVLPDGKMIDSYLFYTPEGPSLINSDSSERIVDESIIEFSMIDDNIRKSAGISIDERIDFDSLTFRIKFASEPQSHFELFPISTKHWISHLAREGSEAVAILQRIKNGKKYLLSIVDVATSLLLRLHTIHEFEASILQMKSDWDLYNSLLTKKKTESIDIAINELLDAPTPTWSDMTRLIEGVNIPSFKRYESVRETFGQLVPQVFPEEIREQIMAFLAWTVRAKVPVDDPLDFLEDIYHKHQSSAILTQLIFGHTQCLIQGVEPPQYVRVMALVDRGLSKYDLGPAVEEAELDPWKITWFRIMEMFPGRKGTVIGLADSLNKKQEVHIEIPITRSEAKRTKEAWLDRFSLIRSNLVTRGYIQDARLGLTKLVYIGGAHRWPHKHLQFTARLGDSGQKPPYIQVLVMPRLAAERVLRIKKSMLLIDWTASRLNYDLYLPKSETWKNCIAHIEKSLGNKRTRRQAEKEFGTHSSQEIGKLSKEDARVLDFASWGISNQSMELGEYNDILSMSKSVYRERLASFIKRGVVHLQYVPTIYGLASICLEIKGEVPQLYSIARSTLLNMPSATAMVSEACNSCIVMARVPEVSAYDMLVNLPFKGNEYDLKIKGYRISAYAGYVNNLYQRLLHDDGTWDDDITGLLSQIRT